MANTIDSNITGLSIAEESTTLGTLPGTPVWYPLEPNSYTDFGGQLATIARNPINPSRQRKKGVVTDLDASGGFSQDLTQTNMTRWLQGFFFADIREKLTNIPMNGTAIPFTGVTAVDDTYTAASGMAGFLAGDLVVGAGFGQSANNGMKNVASSTATTVVVSQALVDETPPATATLKKIGFQFGTGEVNIDVSGSYPRLTRASGSKDFTAFGLIAGEWIFVGGDAAGVKFVTAANNGFARVRAVAATYIEFDKTNATMVAETGTGLTVQIFYGNVIKNEETSALIKRKSYQLERTLGEDTGGTMSEYLVGAVASELTVNVPQAEKITLDLAYVAIDNEQRDGTTGVKSGTRITLTDAPAFNTSSDFSRIKMHIVTAGSPNPTALFAYLTELSLAINNNVSPVKAVAYLGAIDVASGTFEVNANVTAYFADIAAVQAVRNNSDVTLDFVIVKSNAGLIFDLPLVALGDGRLRVEQDQKITLPLTLAAARTDAGYTLLFNEFPYLPTAAG
jgi:hypothetical protein